ncbi:MAG: TPR end-of-group domain-containing protein [Streptosporangiaceae bacterium]
MTGGRDLVSALTGLIGFAAAEEQRLLAVAPAGETGDPGRWAAVPLVAHNTEFRAQQVHRLHAIQAGREPGEFAEIDHRSAEVYQGYASQDAGQAGPDSWRVAGELIGGLAAVPADDLLDPERNPWLRGRQLWLQVVVRGFWHPAGHLADYYLARGQTERAAGLAAQAVALAGYLHVPAQAAGMTWYNLACAQAGAGRLDEAAEAAAQAARLNPDLRAKLGTEPDLAPVRAGGRLAAALA